MPKHTKKVICLSLTALMSCGLLLASGCNKTNKCEAKMKEIISAESFTVSKDGSVIFQYADANAYWNYSSDEYYFSVDSDGKKWVYERDLKDDSWTKEAFTDLNYLRSLYMYKNAFGIDEGMGDIFELICMDFDACMTENNGSYVLKKDFKNAFDDIKCWVDGKTLKMEIDDALYTFYDINKTKVSVPESASKNAETGKVMLP